MKRYYLLFELKMLIHNRKNWLLGLALVLFFPLYHGQYSQQPIESLKDKKNEEADQYNSIFKAFPEEMRETEEGKKIYDNLTEQASLVNMQRFYLWDDTQDDDYIEDGLRLNELRLELHAAGNKGVHPSFVVSEEAIEKELALLNYYRAKDVPVVSDPFVASQYVPAALDLISGIPFSLFVLLIGSTMLLHDRLNRSVMSGLPIPYMQRVGAKVGLHLITITVFLSAAILIGWVSTGLKAGWGSAVSPVLLYSGGTYTAVSAVRYVLLQSVSFLLIGLLLLVLLLLLQELTANTYAAVLAIVSLLLLPSLLYAAGVPPVGWLSPLAMADTGAVLSGEAAIRFGSGSMDYVHAFFWFIGLTLFLLAVLYTLNRLRYVRRTSVQRIVN
ncbi:hypothetical protein NCCP2716_31090 [Sporosarcina sp. NCCP-2716]|uniref:hypothetical protein n=1 Tax=Sporosarcina sp. NCCP-2716 TaxID=2943679 RepID=UPI00203AC9D4|nr:hypothetical protein [Sporosarcina sp. NCCP-2716]GKV70611.1 hypothetical protein NCCP2716_31090 [Sporosarcina sp. NCCP-2716]